MPFRDRHQADVGAFSRMIAAASRAQVLARLHEARLNAAAHPVLAGVAAIAVRLGPVVSIPGVGHLVSDIALAKEVLGAPDRFSKTGPGAVSDTLTGVIGPSALVNMDGEAHRSLRARLQPLFTPRHAGEMVRSSFECTLADVAARLQRGGEVDLVRTARVLTGRVACLMLGVRLQAGSEEDTCLELHRLGAEFAKIVTLTGRALDATRIEAARNRFEALTRIAKAAYDRGDEDSVPGRLRALGLDFQESRGVIGLLLLAGTETVASVLPRIVALLVDSGQWPVLRERRQLMPLALDEGLRLTAAVPVMTRNVVESTMLGGRRLARNERVIVLLFKSLRSPGMGDDPLRFDLGRERIRAAAPLWFGHGPHFCLGAALARSEIEAALTSLLDAGRLSISRRRYAYRTTLPGYSRLVVRCLPQQ